MRKFYQFLGLLVLLMTTNLAIGQVTGIKSIPGDYVSIAAAVADLNTNGVGAGGVTINIAAGHVEALSSTIVLTATGTPSDQIIFQKSGSGANPILTAYAGANAPNAATQDGLFAFEGSDFVTIDGLDLLDTNTVTLAMMEYGYGLFRASATNGCQSITIKNCTITLNRNNFATGAGARVEGSVGIASLSSTRIATTAVSITDLAGSNSFNKFYSNTIRNCNYGIALIGFAAASPFSFADVNNDIGGSSGATGNTIINFGGGSGSTNPSAAIRTLAQYGINVSYNTIDNNNGTGVNHPSTLRGIFLNTATSATAIVSFNNISIKGGATTSITTAIENASGSTASANTINISNNSLNCQYLSATSGEMRGIHNTSTPQTLIIQNNNISNWVYGSSSATGSGANYPIHNAGAAINNIIRENIIQNVFRTGTSGGTTIGIFATAGTNGTNNVTINKNQIRNMRIDGAGTANVLYGIQLGSGTTRADSNIVDSLICIKTTGTSAIYGLYNFASSNNENFNFNKVSNLIHNGTGIVYGLYSFTSTGVRQVSNNEIWNLRGNSTTSGILLSSSVSTVFRNKVYDISSNSATGIVSGIAMSSSTAGTNKFFNNLISNITSPIGSNGTSSVVRGFNFSSTTTLTNIEVQHNTVLISGSGGANFSSSALFYTGNTTATSAQLFLNNNIFINNCIPSGTGVSAAFWYSNTSIANYNTSSNRNIFYAGIPSNENLIFFDGTNRYQTIGAFQGALSPRESSSFSENTSLISTVGSNANFLKPTAGQQSYAESLGSITSILDDFGNTGIRGTYPQAGQLNGGGTAPDMGAWEFDGTPYPLCSSVPSNVSITGSTSVCFGTGTLLSVLGLPANTVGFTYQWQVADTSNAVVFNNLLTGSGQLTGNLTIPKFYKVNVGCSFAGSSVTTPEFGISINALPTIAISNSADTVCSPGFTPVTLTASGASTYSWAPAATLSANTGTTVTANPSSTIAYTATGTDALGCVNSTSKIIRVFQKPNLTPTATPANVCLGANVQLNATNDTIVKSLLITEVTVFRTGTGATAAYPAHITGQDLVEISNISTSAVDVSGYQVRAFGNNSATASHTLTFPSGTIIPAQSVAVVCLGTGTDNAGLLYFNTGGTSDNYSSASQVGIVLSSGSTIIDAVGTSGTLTGTYTFNAGTGVTASEWSGAAPNASGLAGSRRTQAVDNNIGSDWTASGAANVQTIGTFDPIYTFSGPTTYNWTPSLGLNSASLRNPILANVQATSTLTVNALAGNGCTNSATVTVTADPFSTVNLNFSLNDTICVNTNQTLTAAPANGGGPYRYLWNTGDTLASINISPAANTPYSVRVIDNCGDTVNVSTNAVTLPRPTLAIASSQAAICNPGGVATMLIATGAETYAWTPSTGLNVTNNDTISALPSSTTTYTLTGTGVNGCTSVTSIPVIVSAAITSMNVLTADTSVCSGGNTSLNVTASVPSSSYCIPTYANGNQSGDFISNVTIAGTTLANVASGANTNVFTLFPASGSNTATLTAATGYTITLGGGTFGTALVRAWIDFNKNGIFESSESIAITGNIGALATATLPFTIPANALNGETRLRIRSSDTAPGPGVNDACGATNSTYGEVEDYIITISGGVEPMSYSWVSNAALSATNVFNPSVNNLTTTSFFVATATTGDGCSRTDSVKVVAAPYPSAAPTAVNGDLICPGSTANLSATGLHNLNWYADTLGSASLGNGSSFTTSSLSANTTYFVRDITSYGCEGPWASALVTMKDSVDISMDPQTTDFCELSSQSLSVSATGTNLSYQWQKNGVDISGETSSTLNFASVALTDAGNYAVVITSDCDVKTSAIATVTITPAIIADVVLSSSSTSVCGGAAITFTASPINGGAAPAYQWYKNGQMVAGANSSVYVLNNPLEDDSIYVQMTSNASPCLFNPVVNSSAVVLTNSTVIPDVAISTTSNTACVGSAMIFTSTASNTGNAPVYNWMINGNSVGASGSSFSTTVLQNGDVVSLMMTSNAACTSSPIANSNSITVTITNSTAITAQPISSVNCAGTDATFTVAASGTGTLTYQWMKNGAAITNATSATLTLTNVSAADAGSYSVSVSGTCGTVMSNTASLTVNPLTVISNQPSSATQCAGSVALFNVSASGTGTLTYQWKKGGVNITGAVSNVLVLNNITSADAGSYTVEITGGCGVVTSNAATLTVNPLTAITTQPISATQCAGTNATLTVAASGAGTLTYQWMKNGIAISGANSASLALNNLTAADAGSYMVMVTGTCGSVNSNSATVIVNALTAITTQPSAVTTCAGSNASLSVNATGSGTLAYQWKKGGVNVTGATSSSLTFNGISAADAGSYTVEITGTCGTVTSSAAVVTVNALTAITAQPSSLTQCAGTNANFSVTATGSGTLTYQWMKNGTAISGANASTLALTNITAADAAVYSVNVTGTCGTSMSINATLNVNPLTAISAQPVSITQCAGTNAILSVGANGAGVLTYQWKKGGVNVAGAVGSSLLLNNLDATSAGSYTVEITGACGVVTSSAATITVNELTAISVQPVSASQCEGTDISMSVTASGSGTLTYQWRNNGIAIPGANNSTYTITGAALSNTGNYSVSVTGTCGTVNSNNAVVNINPLPVASFTNNAACEGSATMFMNTSTISSGFIAAYHWDLGNGTTTNSPNTSVVYDTAGTYMVHLIATSINGCTDTITEMVVVNALPTVTVTANLAVCRGESATLTAGGADTYSWMPSNTLTSNTGAIVTATPNATTTYMVMGVDTNGCSNSASVTVTVNAYPVVDLGGDRNLCINNTATLDAGNTGATYAWSTGATTQTIAIDGAVLGLGFASFSVDVTANGCTTSDAISVFVDPCTSVDEKENATNVEVYPNPTRGNTTIRLSNVIDSKVSINIINSTGTIILTEQLEVMNGEFVKAIDFSRYAQGLYFLQVNSGNSNILKKIVVQ